MRIRGVTLLMTSVGLAVLAVWAIPGLAKSKDKTLPPYILTARTVAVIVEPGAGVDVEDPRANQVAQKDVETALANWGRFEPVMGTVNADMIIVIRRGHRRLVDTTISDPRQNDRAGVINPTANGISIGGQHGPQPPLSGGTDQRPDQQQSAQPQTEIGSSEDSFTVFDGKVEKPLDSPPGWRYMAKEGLHSHDVPAVDAFRKAVAEADKAAAAKKP